MNKILMTAFQPFGGENENSSIKLLEMLPDHIGNARIIKKILPAVYQKSFEVLEELIQAEHPQAVVATGQAAGRVSMHFERFAINAMHARIRDNKGNKPDDEIIDPEGPAAYRCALDLKSMADAAFAAGCPAAVSHFAGTFVCNDLYYRLLSRLEGGIVPGLFVHIPAAPGQIEGHKLPGVEPELCRDGLVAALRAGFSAIIEGESNA